LRATIFHNPRCSKSREALAILTDAGAAVTVVEYLRTPPSAADLSRLYSKAGLSPREGLRKAEAGSAALVGADDLAILAAMAADPKLIERPLVETAKGVVLARPADKVRQIL
jgi:arsenate reductase (glutaredoxin)